MQPAPVDNRSLVVLSAGAFGAAALVLQSEYLRGVMVVSDGGTLALGAALAAWLAVICLGSLAGAALSRRVGRPEGTLHLVGLLLPPAGLFLLFHLLAFRQTTGLGVGLVAPPLAVFRHSLLSCTPVALCIGLAFPLLSAAQARGATGKARSGVGRVLGAVWAAEALGSFLAGLVFTFLLAGRTSPLSNVLFFGALPALVSLVALGRRYAPAGLLLLLGLSVPVYLYWTPPFVERLAELEWQGLGAPGQRVSGEWGRYGSLVLARNEGQYTLYQSGAPRVVFPDPYADLPLAALLLGQCPEAARVTATGPASGGLAQVLLSAGVTSVTAVYPDRRVEALIRGRLPDSLRVGLDSTRYTYVCADARSWLGRPSEPGRGVPSSGGGSILLLDLPGPARMEDSRYYSTEFFRRAAQFLDQSGGLLALRLPYAATYALGSQLDLAAAVWLALGDSFSQRALAAGPAELFLFAANRGVRLSQDRDTLIVRLARFEPRLAGFSRYFVAPWFEPERVREVREALEARSAQVRAHRDTDPRAWFQHLRLSLRLSGTKQPGVLESLLERLSRVSAGRAVWFAEVPPVLCLLLCALLLRGRSRRAVAALAVGSVFLAGLASLGAMVILQYTCQLVFGALFQQVGLLTAVFMLALAGGAEWSRRLASGGRGAFTGLALALGLLAVFVVLAAALPVLLDPLSVTGPVGRRLALLVFYLTVGGAGFCTGAVFPVAAGVCGEGGAVPPAGRAAGRLNAADHCGAALGAFGVGVLSLPSWGPLTAALALAWWLVGLTVLWFWLRWAVGRP